MFCVIWEGERSLVCEGERSLGRRATLRQEAWEPSIGKKPDTPPAESALGIVPVCKEPPAAQAQGHRDQDKTRRGEPGFGVL